jgi:hypothetical protein
MQQICQKRLDLDLVAPILAASERLGINTTASFITGYPEELEDDQDATLDMIGRSASPACLTQLHMLAPEPGTPLFAEHAHELAYDGYGGPYNAELIGPDDEALVRDHPDIFQTYYYYPAALSRARHIFAVEAVAVLRRVGPIVLRYLLRAYDGRLSNFVRALREFANDAMPDAALDEDFIRTTFGDDHHLTSLFRYALCVNAGGSERVAPPALQPVAFDVDGRYRISHDVRVLADLHDCAVVIANIERDQSAQLLAEDGMGERGVYVVETAGPSSKSYRIDPGVEAILGMFEEPRSCREVIHTIREITGGADVGHDFFEELVRAGILVAPENARLAAVRA